MVITENLPKMSDQLRNRGLFPIALKIIEPAPLISLNKGMRWLK